MEVLRDCSVTKLGDTQKSSGHSPGQLTLDGPARAGVLEQMTSRGPFDINHAVILCLWSGKIYSGARRGANNPNCLKSVAEEERRVGAEEGKTCKELEQSVQGIPKQVEIPYGNEKKTGPCFQFCQYLVCL